MRKKALVSKKVKFDGVEIPSRNSQMKRDVAPPTAKLPSHSGSSPQCNNNSRTMTNQPQYRYIAPIKDPAVAPTVVTKMLDLMISIMQRELLALAPDVRK